MKAIALTVFLFISTSVNAIWINATGKVEEIWTYGHVDTVLIRLSVDGADVSECSSKTHFAISKNISSEARSRMYSMLLAAQTKGNPVTIAFNDFGNCEPWDSNQNAYRKIVRVANKT